MTEPLTDLGWHNAGGATARAIDEAVGTCRKLGHVRTDKDHDPYRRGAEHEVICWTCKFKYHYDSSD